MPQPSKRLVSQIGGTKTLKIIDGANVAKQIADLDSIVESKKIIRNNLMIDQGATSMQQQFFERQAEPITRAIGRSREDVITEKINQNLPLTKSEQKYYTDVMSATEVLPIEPAGPPVPGSIPNTEVYVGRIKELRQLGQPA
jgi:hypothetical protein